MHTHTPGKLELWGGVEATINRVGERYFNQLERSGHLRRDDDLARFAALGIRALRHPVLWESVAPDGLERADWRWADRSLAALRQVGVTPIVGLMHHGSGPRHTSLAAPAFAAQLAEFAGAVARRYPWLEYYTPVNEPLTTARFSGLYGLWYPHGRDDVTFVRILVNQCRGVAMAMRAIRAVNPSAKLVQTEDLCKNYGTPQLAGVVEFYNQRRWLTWDLLCGMVTPGHALWTYLAAQGVDAAELRWLADNPCPPDIIGADYYVTSERWLDHRRARYPPHAIGPAGFADVDASRALAAPLPGIGPLIDEVWQRYALPIALTETHIDAHREDQLRWLMENWRAAEAARRRGVDLRAVTVWALLGAFDWHCLVTEERGYYESGAFDLRAPRPRATAVATLMRELAEGRAPSSPVLPGLGWWRRPGRFVCKPVHRVGGVAPAITAEHLLPPAVAQPLLIAGADSAPGRAFGRLCGERGLAHVPLARQDLDHYNPVQVELAIARHRPWAIVDAAGDRPDSGNQFLATPSCGDGVDAAVTLATACTRHALRLLIVCCDLAVSPGQLPDHVHACLDLLIDNEVGVWRCGDEGPMALETTHVLRRPAP